MLLCINTNENNNTITKNRGFTILEYFFTKADAPSEIGRKAIGMARQKIDG